ncbi:MAG: hypothetical protein GKR94_03075 [Gammaproteobacteria bacterium]|nr:hypothetical protein [Gammaproteobacteria bacterium]
MNQMVNVIDPDDDFDEDPSAETTLTPEDRDRRRSAARRRIEALREEAALKRDLTDDILDYYLPEDSWFSREH